MSEVFCEHARERCRNRCNQHIRLNGRNFVCFVDSMRKRFAGFSIYRLLQRYFTVHLPSRTFPRFFVIRGFPLLIWASLALGHVG